MIKHGKPSFGIHNEVRALKQCKPPFISSLGENQASIVIISLRAIIKKRGKNQTRKSLPSPSGGLYCQGLRSTMFATNDHPPKRVKVC